MAIRFQSIFPSERDTEITLNIHDSEYVGSIIPFNSDSQGYRLTYSEAGSEQTQRFMSTQCEVVFRVEDETQFLLITDFLESQEGRFLISIEEDAALVWVGVVLPDVTKYDESPFPIDFTLKATDGVGALKDVPFKNGSSFYTGKARIIEFITRALSKIVYVSEFYTTGDIFVRSSVDWWEENMTHVSDGSDMLYQAYLDNAVYYTFDKGAQDVKSCYDVLNDILTSLGMRLTFARGAFHIEQLPYRVSDIIIQRNYGPDGAFISAVNYNDQNLIDQTAQGALLATGEYEFTAPISKAEHKFAALERRNFFAGAQEIDDTHTGIDTFYIPIQSNGNNTTLRITGSLVLRISSNISAPGYTAPLNPFFAVIRMNLFLDTVGLQRTYTAFQTFQFVYETATWNATPGCYFIQPIGGVFLANTTDDIFTFTQTIDLITPPLTESTDSFTCTWSLESLKNYDGTTVTNWATDFNTTYEISNLWLEAYSNGGPVLSGDGDIYYTNNSETQNTLVWKTEGLIGSSTNPNTVGAIWVKPASDYILAELWGAGSDTPAFSFVGQMLTRDIAKTHAKPARKLNGTLYGDIVSVSRVVWQSENWILLGGTWNAVNNLFSGTWIEMKTVSGLTPSNPIKFVAWPDPEPPNTSTETPGVDGPFMVGAPHGSVWYAIASTLSDESIRAGTPGTIDIQDTLSDYDFNAGDTVAIINPLSGVFETLLVANTTTNGQTALTVTGSIVGTYPAGSPIVRIPRIGGPFSLPGGVAGQIMRHDGTKWTAYGTSALTDGHILTWTDAGGWAAAASPAGYTDEQAQDAVGSMLSDSTEIDFTYTDATPSLTAVLKTTGVSAGTYNSLTVDIKGRVTAATLIAYLTANQSITLSGDVTGSGTTAIATTITNNAVTVAKMAQLAGLSILGRSANSTGNMAAITASVALSYLRLNAGGTALEWGTLPASGTLTGNGVATRIPVYNGTTSFTNIAGFNFDTTNFRLQISEEVTPSASTATIDVDYGTITGSREWVRINGNLSSNMTATIFNTRNVGGSGDNIFTLATGGASGGDPILQFLISGVETWSIGVDNSDADKLKIKPQASPGAGASGGEGITMTTAVTPLVGINTDAPAHPLDVNGFARALTYTSRTDATGGTGGTVTFGTGAGSGPSLFSVVLPNGNMCTVRWTQGTSGTAGGRVLNIAIPTVLRHASKIYVTFSANNDLTARDIAKFSIDYSGTTPGSIALKSNALLTALDDGGDYLLTMHITGHA